MCWILFWILILVSVLFVACFLCKNETFANLSNDYFIVYSVGNSPYQEWQADLLDFSVRFAHQPGKIIRIVSEDSVNATGKKRKVAKSSEGETVVTPDFSEIRKGEIQKFMNKSASIEYWVNSLSPAFKKKNANAVCILLDPDMIFTKKWTPKVPKNTIVGQEWVGYSYEYCVNTSESKNLCAKKTEDGYMFPFAIRLEDLCRIAGDITTFARRGYLQDNSRWMLEMTSFVNGAVKGGMKFQNQPNVGLCNNWKNSDDPNAPIMHFCQIIKRNGKEIWGKRRYNKNYDPETKKFEPSPDPKLAENRVDREVLKMLKRFQKKY